MNLLSFFLKILSFCSWLLWKMVGQSIGSSRSLQDFYIKLFWLLLVFASSQSLGATIKDVFNITPEAPNSEFLTSRVARDNKHYLSRYGGGASLTSNSADKSRSLKPEDSPEARENANQNVPLEKRCIRCDATDGYRSRYDDRRQYRDYDRYDDRRTDYLDRDRYYDRRSDYYDRGYYRGDRYDPYYERGVGYDNRGYDNRGYDTRYERDYPRQSYYDDPYRYYDTGRSGYGGRPDYGYYGNGYASNWNYGRDEYRDRDRGTARPFDKNTYKISSDTIKYGGGSGYGGYSTGGGYRSRDPYEGYRGTSYLYDRPSTTTLHTPGDLEMTPSPPQDISG